MTAEAVLFKADREHGDSMRAIRKIERDLERVRNAAKRIRHSDELYRERLEGRRASS